MSDLAEMLDRQARWQEIRQCLIRPEKIHLAERVLDSVRQWGPRRGPEARKPAPIEDKPSG